MPRPYEEVRKRYRRELLLDFLIKALLPDSIDYDQLDLLKDYVNNNSDDQGECDAFCDYYELGNWFKDSMEECDFCVGDFYDEYAKEIERRAEP